MGWEPRRISVPPPTNFQSEEDSAIEIITIQPEGKPEMSAKAFCNGGKIKAGAFIKE